MKQKSTAIAMICVSLPILCLTGGTAFAQCCDGGSPPPTNQKPSSVSFSDGSGSALPDNSEGNAEQELTVPCEFDVTLSATDEDGTVEEYIKTGGHLPGKVSLSGNTLSGTIGNNCDASGSPWGSTWKAEDDDNARSENNSTLLLNCQERSNRAPTEPVIIDGSIFGRSFARNDVRRSCSFRVQVKSTDPDGSIKEYQLGSCDLPNHTFDKKNGILKNSVVAVGVMEVERIAVADYTCKVRAKDNDCKYGPYLTLKLTCAR